MLEPIRIFIGFDQAEAVAYHALCQSIIENCNSPVQITPVKLSMLPMYHRERDPKQSNEFSFSRFLVPYLCNYEGYAIFMDLDMFFRAPVEALWNQRHEDGYCVKVVKHDYTPKNDVKYMGAIQYPYPKKNWSSVMLFSNAECKALTPEYVNTAPALDLHRFHWCDKHQVRSLLPVWNHLVGEYPYDPIARIVHFTNVGPWFYNEPLNCEYGDEWIALRDRAFHADDWRVDPNPGRLRDIPRHE